MKNVDKNAIEENRKLSAILKNENVEVVEQFFGGRLVYSQPVFVIVIRTTGLTVEVNGETEVTLKGEYFLELSTDDDGDWFIYISNGFDDETLDGGESIGTLTDVKIGREKVGFYGY